jgi:uncharacterized membrane protein
MEVYAGYSENADWNIGRIIDAIDELGELENTVVIWIWGDNGASMEGTLTGTFNEMTTLNGIPLTPEQQLGLLFKHGGLEAWGDEQLAPHYAAGWAWAGNAPFDWGKQVASHLGGTRNPLVVHWPGGIGDAGAVRSHYTHVTDVGATILDLARIPMPASIDGVEQQPFDGATFADSLSDVAAPERHSQQYYEILGNRGMYKDGWLFCQRLQRIPWSLDPEALRKFGPGWDPDSDPVELYYLPDDFTQSKNIAADHPEKVQELGELFWAEAERNHVLPLLGGLTSFFGMVPPIPEESKFVYRGDIQNIPSGMIPRIYNHSYTISAELVVPEGGAEGVIVAEADHLGGFALFVQDGKLKHTYSMLGVLEYTQAAEQPLPTGEVTVELVFTADAPKPATGGVVTLRQRRAGRERADGAHRAGPLLGLLRHGHWSRQWPRRGPQLCRQGAVRLHGRDQAGRLRRRPGPEQGGRERAPRARGSGLGGTRGERLRWRRERSTMSDNEQLDVLIAVYLVPDLAQQDFDAYAKLAGDGEIVTDGVALVVKDAKGEVHVQETGDHLGRKGVKAGAGVGLVIGLFAPPLLAATVVGGAVGGLAGKFARHRLQAGIGDKLDDALPPGSAGIIAIYEHDGADAVASTLANAIRTSTAQIDKASAEALKAGLKEASAGLAG